MTQNFADLGMALLYGTEYERLVRDAYSISRVPTDNRGAIYRYEGGYGVYFLKPYESLTEERVLPFFMLTGLSLVEAQFGEAYLERKSEAPVVEKLFLTGAIGSQDLAVILSGGFNRLHSAGIVYGAPIGEHWFYNPTASELRIIDLGEATLVGIGDSVVDELVSALCYMRWLHEYGKKENGELERAVESFGMSYISSHNFHKALERDAKYSGLRQQAP